MNPEMILVIGAVAFVLVMVALGRALFPKTTWADSNRDEWPEDCSFNTMHVWPADPQAHAQAEALCGRS